MFIPGHLHLASASEVDRQAFDIHLLPGPGGRGPPGGRTLRHGGPDRRPAFQRASNCRATPPCISPAVPVVWPGATACACGGPIVRQRREYDAMFDDLRRRLKLKSGEAIDLDRYLRGEGGAS